MHELPVVESMMEIVLRHAERSGAKQVTRINLVLGEMSTVMEEPVRFYFDILKKDTVTEGAELVFRRTKLISRCSRCGEEFEVKEYDFTCPECESTETGIISGREFRVESIEIK